jgi:hypothetical protein
MSVPSGEAAVTAVGILALVALVVWGSRNGTSARSFVVGVALGLVLGTVGASFPVLGLPLLSVTAIATLAHGLLPSPRAPQLALSSGILAGSGALFLYGVATTYVACVQTVDFCGDTPILRLAALAAVTLTGGAAIGWKARSILTAEAAG